MLSGISRLFFGSASIDEDKPNVQESLETPEEIIRSANDMILKFKEKAGTGEEFVRNFKALCQEDIKKINESREKEKARAEGAFARNFKALCREDIKKTYESHADQILQKK
jgi:hypothetical protein